jgi:hypothetical protein
MKIMTAAIIYIYFFGGGVVWGWGWSGGGGVVTNKRFVIYVGWTSVKAQ